jgi:hypothetical protein
MDSPHVILALALILIWVSAFVLGIYALLAYMVHRMLKSDGWDDSNMNNALRLISHVTLHPEDFGRMYYVSREGEIGRRPFWYVGKDEFEDVVRTRPSGDNI